MRSTKTSVPAQEGVCVLGLVRSSRGDALRLKITFLTAYLSTSSADRRTPVVPYEHDISKSSAPLAARCHRGMPGVLVRGKPGAGIRASVRLGLRLGNYTSCRRCAMVRSLAVAEELITGPERAGIQRVESRAQDGEASPRGISLSEDRGMEVHRRGPRNRIASDARVYFRRSQLAHWHHRW